MTVKRYFAATARDCLRKVKEDLGPDAIVVSNKSVRGGIEITAMSAASLDEISNRAETVVDSTGSAINADEQRLVANGSSRYANNFTPATPPIGFASTSSDDYTVNISSQARRFEKRLAPEERPTFKQPIKQPSVSPWQPPRYEPATGKITPAAAEKPVAERDFSAKIAPIAEAEKSASIDRAPYEGPNLVGVQELSREIRDIRNMLEQQLAGFAWGELSRISPTRAQLMTELLEVGFSGVLARRMTQDLTLEATLEEGRKHVSAVLDSRLQLFNTDNDIVQRGGVYALVGPTGVGKTTTAAKLAARCVVRYGADRVALLTTDGYRIGAHEQLRIYGRILGVPVHAVGDAEELGQTLLALKDKHMVLIDTVGMSQRDRMVIEQGAMLASSGKVKRLLLLNATSRGDTLDDVIQAYGGEDISGCIVSKIDETTTLAPAVDAIVRHGMSVAYLANGQRVPEDLHLPNRQYLLHRVFKQRQGNMAHRLKTEEIGMALAGHADQQDKSVSFG